MDQEVVQKDMMAAKSAKEAEVEAAEGNVTQAEVRWGKTAVVGWEDSTEKVEVVKSVLLEYS